MSNEEMAVLIKQGHREYIKPLWENVYRLVCSSANKYYIRLKDFCDRAGVTQDDLIQEGYFAFLDAINGFDPSSGFKFITYLKYPFINRFNNLAGLRTQKQLKDPINSAYSLDEPLKIDEDDKTFGDTIEDESGMREFENLEDKIYQQQLHDALDTCMGCLTETQKDVLTKRYYKNMTLQEVADANGTVSRESVRQEENRAIRRMRRVKSIQILRPFAQDIICKYGYKGVGFKSFSESGMSSTERVAFKLMEMDG